MKTLNASLPSGGSPASRFESAKALALSIAESGNEFVDVGDEMSFIFTESSPFDSYGHFGHGPFVNLRDAQGNEMICRPGGVSCVPLDEWTSKLT